MSNIFVQTKHFYYLDSFAHENKEIVPAIGVILSCSGVIFSRPLFIIVLQRRRWADVV